MEDSDDFREVIVDEAINRKALGKIGAGKAFKAIQDKQVSEYDIANTSGLLRGRDQVARMKSKMSNSAQLRGVISAGIDLNNSHLLPEYLLVR